jgi:hypothetical protein
MNIMDIGHNMKFKSTYILDKAAGCMAHMMKETTKIPLNPSDFNKDTGFVLN